MASHGGLELAWLARRSTSEKSDALLTVEDLVVRVGIRTVLDGFSLRLQEGDHVLLTGPNGCGKSTVLNAIAGVRPAQVIGGRIVFRGDDITRLPAHRRSSMGIGYLRQLNFVFPGLTIAENLQLAGSVADRASELPDTHVRAGALSGGQAKLLGRAMIMHRRHIQLFLLDEPATGVSGRTALDLSALSSAAILRVEHLASTEECAQ